ncbi:hypothetical protein SAMD00079811_23400 [Scytonema sp. HK-05]|uniref:hypothetical protein n=1 Tax=Scytonema sp. HK-05 TaxID=1137095 RepID=UPI0009366F0C|nr:hypothetical protein [Scytonema sp. HK-05]OKH60463.1 hypothetical protein NIES2130_03445 [Scytonema sp. HK-05]BAY44738.1 hypothetical protein SAMD00079811_23400 [Scytonema sp. HK-05]
MTKNELLGTALAFFIGAGGGWFVSQRTFCVFSECILAYEGNSIWNARGYKIDEFWVKLIQASPYACGGLGACFLIARLIKS